MGRRRRDVPWLEQHDNGFYYVHWYDPTAARTRRDSLHTKAPLEARKAFGGWLLHQAELTAAPAKNGGDLTVAEALDQYLAEHVTAVDDHGREKVACSVRQEIAARFLKQFFGAKPVRDVTIEQCEGYTTERRAGRIGGGSRHKGDRAKGSDSTVRRELVVLRAAAGHALKRGRILVTDMPKIELPGENERPHGEEPWLRKPELDAVFAAAEGDLADFARLAYYTAYRRATVETLHAAMIDLETGVINPYKRGARRTVKRRAIVPIFPEIREIVERRSRNARDGFLFREGIDFYRPFTELCESAEIDEGRRHPHVLRHSRATHMLLGGVSIYKVARLLGDTVKTVEKTYGHFSAEFLAEHGGA